MTAPARPRLRVGAPRIVPGPHASSPRARLVRAVRRAGRLVMRPARALFPRRADGAPVALAPGEAALIDVSIHAPGRDLMHLYAGARTLAGAASLAPPPAQAVAIGPDGRGTAQVLAAPLPDGHHGLARLRLVAVDPDFPERIDDATDNSVQIAVAGSDGAIRTVLAAFFGLGVAAQMAWPDRPMPTLFLLLALACAWIAAPRGVGASWRPMALLAPGRRRAAAGWILAGALGWTGFMMINLWGDNPGALACGAGGETDCDGADSLLDNLTALAASVMLCGGIGAALAPAVRPRRVAGYAALIGAAFPAMLYDLTLLGEDIPGDEGRIAMAGFYFGFAMIGWLSAAIGVAAVLIHQKAGGWSTRIRLILLGLVSLPAAHGLGFWLAFAHEERDNASEGAPASALGDISVGDHLWLVATPMAVISGLILCYAVRRLMRGAAVRTWGGWGRRAFGSVLILLAMTVAEVAALVLIALGPEDGPLNERGALVLPLMLLPVLVTLGWMAWEVRAWERARAARHAARKAS